MLAPKQNDLIQTVTSYLVKVSIFKNLVFTGNAHRALGISIAKSLGKRIGNCNIGRFQDGEVRVKIDETVRGKDVYVVQPTCPPVNQNILELILIISALRRASAKRVTVIIPYFGYTRNVYKFKEANGKSLVSRKSHSLADEFNSGNRKKKASMFAASDVAKMLEVAGAQRVVVLDMQIPGFGVAEGYFRKAQVESLKASEIIIKSVVQALDLDNSSQNLVVLAPHSTGITKANEFRDKLTQLLDKKIGLASLINKPDEEESELLGNVKGKSVLIVQDIIDTGKTLLDAVAAAKAGGASEIFVYATHALLTEDAALRIGKSDMINQIVALDTLPITRQKFIDCPQLKLLPIAPAIANLIRKMHYSKNEK